MGTVAQIFRPVREKWKNPALIIATGAERMHPYQMNFRGIPK
jgi:hypothetical protein